MSDMQRERDLVLNPNEYAYVLDKTKGLISCVVGPYKMSLSTSDALVTFNERTKRFEEASFTQAITIFTSAPENWYVVLKNPAESNKHPTPGTANPLLDLRIGKKVNIQGNISFPLYPGQMAKVIPGHRLRSNQYLLARVYDTESLADSNKYTIGQLLVIKGTEVQFYIPPTGIEVIPVNGKGNQYIRDAVTLERLEYCILKDEQGNKKYIHGAAVVFPEPTQSFVTNDNGGYKFKAIELSEISGIYVKVIADYEENGEKHKTGEELFITGKDQMIYYPRAEHAIIDYEGKIVHHAIAIPVGEGRYILNRKTGVIKTVRGSAMYLPDPREEVVVQRRLTVGQCNLWYPGNSDVLAYNTGITPVNIQSTDMNVVHTSFCHTHTLTADRFSRQNTYSKPRTIVLDNKYDGVVTIEVWTGYAINVISKNGDRKVITGPQTYLMEYDETLEALELSTGKPKTTDHLLETVFLRTSNNKISDLIKVQTKDYVEVEIKVSYCVDFLPEYKDKWFSVQNYVKYMCDRQRSLIKAAAKIYNIEEFYENAARIVRDIALNISSKEAETKQIGRFFKENGMLVHDVEILSVHIDADIQDIMTEHQEKIIKQSLELSAADKEIEISEQLANIEQARIDLLYANKQYKLKQDSLYAEQELAEQAKLSRLQEQEESAKRQAEFKLQEVLDAIQKATLARQKEISDAELARKQESNKLEIDKQNAYTKSLKTIIDSISPDLIASMNSSANAQLLQTIAQAMSPYAIARGESIADVTNLLLRGTSLEGLVENISNS